MLHATLNDPGTWMPLLGRHRVWLRSLDWLKRLTPETPLGTFELDGPRWYASVQEYQTLERPACRFESHEEHIDIQYTISGSEYIDWCERGTLQPDGTFTNDVQFWLPPQEAVTALHQTPGRFAVFLPSDAHRPKVADLQPGPVRKVVIKVHRSLVESEASGVRLPASGPGA
jgi:YhcH/YjgK/YiaL family protein